MGWFSASANVRRSQVEKIKNARQDLINANRWDGNGTKPDRARANAVLDSLLGIPAKKNCGRHTKSTRSHDHHMRPMHGGRCQARPALWPGGDRPAVV